MKKKNIRSRNEIDLDNILLGLIGLALFLLFCVQWIEREQNAYAYIDSQLKAQNQYEQQVEKDRFDERVAREENYE